MNRILINICATFACLCAPLSSEIIEAYHLKEFLHHLQDFDAESLILWDVDSTLIIPRDQILKPGNEDILNEIEMHYFHNKSPQEVRYLVSQVFQRMPFCLVDEEVATLVSALQNRSIPMLGLTAMRTGPFGVIESMENWRVNQLRLLGIDFSGTFPQYAHLTWEESSPRFGHPAIKEGVICCDHVPKGIVLTSFLQKIDWRPRQVLFIDDCLEFVQSVDAAMAKLNIPCICVHYRAVEKMETPVDEALAHYQLKVLVNEQIWLSDTEAKERLTIQTEQIPALPVDAAN